MASPLSRQILMMHRPSIEVFLSISGLFQPSREKKSLYTYIHICDTSTRLTTSGMKMILLMILTPLNSLFTAIATARPMTLIATTVTRVNKMVLQIG